MYPLPPPSLSSVLTRQQDGTQRSPIHSFSVFTSSSTSSSDNQIIFYPSRRKSFCLPKLSVKKSRRKKTPLYRLPCEVVLSVMAEFQLLGFNPCPSCSGLRPLTDGHSRCLFCLGESYTLEHWTVCHSFSTRMHKSQDA